MCNNSSNRSHMEQELKISPMPFGQARLPVQALFDFFPFRETQQYQAPTFLQIFDSSYWFIRLLGLKLVTFFN